MLVFAMAVAAAPAMAQDPGNGAGGTTPDQPSSQGTASTGAGSGGQEYGVANPATTQIVERATAKLLPGGMAAAPSLAPPEVQAAIFAANEIVGRPYVYGGGHNRSFRSEGYDCSGTVSYA